MQENGEMGWGMTGIRRIRADFGGESPGAHPSEAINYRCRIRQIAYISELFF